MEISLNNIGSIRQQSVKKPVFTADKPAAETNKSAEIPEKPTDYAVRVPIAYSHVEDVKLNDDITAKCYKLANGQRVVIVPKQGETVVKTYVGTGSFNEPDNIRGISHFIEHNLFNGSEDLGEQEFFDEVNKLGAYTNASTSFAITDYIISSNLLENKDLEEEIRLQAGMVQSPKFLTEKLEKEKKIVNSEINMCLSEKENIGYTQTVKNLFNVQSSSLDLVAGSTDNITALTRDDVVNYFNNNYYPANMVTVISGEIDPDETMKLVSKYFNSTKMPQGERKFEKMTPTQKAVRQDIISKKSESDSASVFLGFAGPENNNYKDNIYLDALFSLAGGLHNSRFTKTERKYGTVVNMVDEKLSSRPQDLSMIMIEAGVPEDKIETFLKDLYYAINGLSTNPPTQEELDAVKFRMKKNKDTTLEMSAVINSTIGHSMLNDSLKELTEYDQIVDNMTVDDIVNIAKKYLDLNKVALTVVHPNFANEDKIQANYNGAVNTPVSFTGKNKKTPVDMSRISAYKTSNNYEVVFNDASTNNIYYKYTIAESNWIPKNPSVGLILSSMLKNAGTTNSTIEELSSKADSMGISYRIGAGDYGINITGNFPVEKEKEALEFYSNLVKNPNLTQEEFDKAVKRIKDKLMSHEVSPFDKLNKSIYAGTNAEYNTKDLLEALDKATLDDVIKFYGEIFKNGMGCVTATGPFNKNPELKQEIFDSLNGYTPVQPWSTDLEDLYKPIEKTEVFTDVHNKNQANIVEAFKFKYGENIKDRACLDVLNYIFGGGTYSRLFNDLRETRHLAYGVSSGYDNKGNIGVFVLNIGTTTENQETGEKTFDNIEKSINGFNENIAKIMSEPVTEEELESAKKALKSSLLNSLEMNSSKNGAINGAKHSPYNIEDINIYFETIDKITSEDILNTARNIFNSKPDYSIVATKASLDANKEFLEKLKD